MNIPCSVITGTVYIIPTRKRASVIGILSPEFQMLASIHQALRSEGRIIIIDFRRDPRVSSKWIMGHVRGNKSQVIQEMQTAGFRLADDKPLMRSNYFQEFMKSGRLKDE